MEKAGTNASLAETEGLPDTAWTPVALEPDRRVERTRRALGAALIGLLATREYDALTVGEILDVADVGRSTFYSHFSGKDDLLRYGLEKLGEELRARGKAGSNPSFAFVGPLLDHVAANREALRRLKGRGAKVFRHGLNQLLGELAREASSAGSRTFDPVRELEIRFVTGALSATILWWLERNSRLEPSDVEAVILRLIRSGLSGVI